MRHTNAHTITTAIRDITDAQRKQANDDYYWQELMLTPPCEVVIFPDF